MAAFKPVNLVAGDTWARSWVLSDDAGQPIDLTGASARLHVRDKQGTLHASATSALAGGIVITPLTGRIEMEIAAATTGLLAPGPYRYALEVTFGDGRVRTIETNNLVVSEDLTYG